MAGLKIGDKAPDFELTDKSGKTIKLSDLYKDKNVVLYFYPKDNTPGCTAQACEFRDSYQDFIELGAEVIGVSSDSDKSHESFKSKFGLPFILISDKGGAIRKAYGVPATFFILPGRVTFIIDKKGIIQHIFNSQFKSTQHIPVALDVLKKLQ